MDTACYDKSSIVIWVANIPSAAMAVVARARWVHIIRRSSRTCRTRLRNPPTTNNSHRRPVATLLRSSAQRFKRTMPTHHQRYQCPPLHPQLWNCLRKRSKRWMTSNRWRSLDVVPLEKYASSAVKARENHLVKSSVRSLLLLSLVLLCSKPYPCSPCMCMSSDEVDVEREHDSEESSPSYSCRT